MAGPSIHLNFPPLSLFKFPPDAEPLTVPPPPPPATDELSLKNPVPISTELFHQLLSPAVPLTVASIYIAAVIIINGWNRRRGNKPWAISRTRSFYIFVLLHNIFLAVYSGVTFIAIFQALKRIWPGINGEFGVTEAVDAFCHIHGPRGLGSAAAFHPSTGAWEIRNKEYYLTQDGTPDPTDVGRLWNEGLAFWGWLFYLSKFYEVLDTFIILAKGKRSSTLQTYHHAGAMLGMWAGIRYMSPPIWMFCFMNSFIHSLMYTYYTLSALGVRVPQAIKRTLTTMQISQFVLGASSAVPYLFVSYTVPVSTPYTVIEAVKSVASAASSTASIASDMISATAMADVGSYLKKLAFLAAGEEGLAHNVRDKNGASDASAISEPAINMMRRHTTHYRNEYHKVSCIDTTGQAFAIWLNVMYLFPLTILFVRFFIRSYTRRTSLSTAHKTQQKTVTKATKDAAHGVEREVKSLGKSVENDVQKLGNKAIAGVDTQRVSQSMQKLENAVKETSSKASEQLKASGELLLEKGKKLGQDAAKASYTGEEMLQRKIEEALAEIKSESSTQDADVKTPNGNAQIKEKGTEQQNGHLTPPPSDQEENGESRGLSTTDPRDADDSYADKLKH